MKPTTAILVLAGVFGMFLGRGTELLGGQGARTRVTEWPGGHKKSEIVVDGDLRQGTARTWYENGTPHSQGQYVDDLASGKWEWWNEDGTLDLSRSGIYEDGEKVAEL